MNNEILQMLLDRLEDEYGNLSDDSGAYSFNDNTSEYVWLSVSRIVDIIKDVDQDYC